MKWLRENGAGLYFAAATLFALLLLVFALLGGGDRSRQPVCHGTTGEYVGPDGRAVLNPYDSLCVPQPSPLPDETYQYQGG